jgi:hypothetical protein
MKPLDLLLTKEAFDAYATHLREEKACEYGMTLEQWDEAIRTGATVSHNTQPPTEWNGPTSSFNG